MNLTVEQYLGFSALSYVGVGDVTNGSSIASIVSTPRDDLNINNPEFQSLSSLGSWTLLGFETYPSGLAVMAFLATQPLPIHSLVTRLVEVWRSGLQKSLEES